MKLAGALTRPFVPVLVAVGLLAGCPGTSDTKPVPGKGEPVAAVNALIKEEPAGPVADKDSAPADAPAKDDAGCIYVDSDKGHDGLECPHPVREGGEPDAPPDGDGHFGQAFAMTTAVPLSTALKTAAGSEPVFVSGEVEAVCEKKGCWMVIKDGTESARVLMKDAAFAVPMDCRGKKVQVEGTLAARTFTEEQVKHLAKDAGKNPDEVSGERKENVLTATGINIQS